MSQNGMQRRHRSTLTRRIAAMGALNASSGVAQLPPKLAVLVVVVELAVVLLGDRVNE